jgi:prepilin-type N-terminal cleavage/methylation domain-containing protein
MRQRSGFTLIELLLASAIMTLILTALGGLFASSIRANQANTRLAENQQNMEAAIQLLKNEISLAGYRGTDIDAGTRKFSPANAPTLVVTAQSATRDRISVHFFQDRYVPPSPSPSCPSGPPCEQTVTFGVNPDNELTRQQNGGFNRAVAEGVTSLKVTNYLLASGGTSSSMPANRADIRGITVRLTSATTVASITTTTTRDVTIALSNPQQ